MESLVKILVPRQLILMLLLSTGLLNHVILIPNLLSASGRDSWLSVLVAYPISLVFIGLMYFVIKHSSPEGFIRYIQIKLGKSISLLFVVPIVLFLLGSTYITFRDLVVWLNTYFLADTSVMMISFILVVACFLITLAGIKTIAIASGFLLPTVVLLGIFIATTNTGLKDPILLFPVLAHGYAPVIKGIVYTLSGLLEVFILLLLQPFAQEPIRFRHLFFLLTFLTGLILGPLSASIMEFGVDEATHYLYPAYEQWRVLGIGEYINHLDFFALYQWLAGAFVRIGLFMYLVGYFFVKQDSSTYHLPVKTVGSL